MKHKIFSLLLILLLSSFSTWADDSNWAFDPYDFQYDMTAYVGLSVDGSRADDLAQYKVGAFCGDQCRGIMEVKNAGNIQYGYLRIRSNRDNGEQITFKVLDSTTGELLKCDNTLEFISQAVEGVPSSPLILSAANKYKVEYVVFDEVYSTEEVYYGDQVPSIEAPEKEGYTFNEWINLPEMMPAKDITITASYTVNSYTLTFVVDGEVIISEATVEYGSDIVAPEAPEKEGYSFAGWDEYPETMPAHDLTINGSYSINSYKLTFIVDGEAIAEQEVEYGAPIEALEAPEKEGYTFSEWVGLPETMPAKDVTVTGSYTINSYTLIFVVDGEVVSEQEVEYGSEIVTPEMPEKEGYTFDGWKSVPETMPAANLTLYSYYTINTYCLTYIIDGEVVRRIDIEYASPIEAIEAPEKEGYSFTGWDGLPETMPAQDVTVSGSYTINSYTLTFKIGNEIISESVVEYGSKIVEPAEVPEKEGYIFDGWEEYPETMPAHDLTINGHYADNSFKLTYMIDGEVVAEVEVEIGTVLEPIEAPEKEGYSFNGWEGLPETMPAADVTVTGSYTINTYTLTFVLDNEVISEQTLEYSSEIVAPEVPEKEGYTFEGWEECPERMPAHDLTVYGYYSINNYKLTYILDGEVIDEVEVEYGIIIDPYKVPEKEGYTFIGWEGLPETMPAADVTVTGSYTINSYTLTFTIDGEAVSQLTVEYGSDIVAPEAPEKEGYSFDGWEEFPNTMPAYDLTINGSYSINTYVLTYVIDGKVVEIKEVEYGTAIEAVEAPEKEGYTFNGWEGIPETMPAKDTIVTGSYTINSYTLTFKIGNEVISQEVVEYGSEIIEPEVPEKEGFDFAGWEEHPETMPAYDLTINGHYEGNSYKLTYVIDGDTVAEFEVEFGTILEAIEAPEKEGYSFNGWEGLPETMPGKDVTVTGSYTINSYTLIFVIDGEVVSEQTLEYGSQITAPEAPEREGYTFDGWEECPETMPATDMTINGSYTVNVYTVTYMIDDEVIRIDNVEYGQQLPEAPEAPEKEDYEFLGWSEIPETMPAQDIVIVGTYEYSAGLNSIFTDSVKVDIFDIQGRLIKKGIDSDSISDYVHTGVYIIGGKKVLVK